MLVDEDRSFYAWVFFVSGIFLTIVAAFGEDTTSKVALSSFALTCFMGLHYVIEDSEG